MFNKELINTAKVFEEDDYVLYFVEDMETNNKTLKKVVEDNYTKKVIVIAGSTKMKAIISNDELDIVPIEELQDLEFLQTLTASFIYDKLKKEEGLYEAISEYSDTFAIVIDEMAKDKLDDELADYVITNFNFKCDDCDKDCDRRNDNISKVSFNTIAKFMLALFTLTDFDFDFDFDEEEESDNSNLFLDHIYSDNDIILFELKIEIDEFKQILSEVPMPMNSTKMYFYKVHEGDDEPIVYEVVSNDFKYELISTKLFLDSFKAINYKAWALYKKYRDSMSWFIIKYFGEGRLEILDGLAEKEKDLELLKSLNDIWFYLPDGHFNIKVNPPGFSELLEILDYCPKETTYSG